LRLKPSDLKPEIVPIDSVKPFPGNAATHDERLLEESVDQHGVFRPVLVSEDGYVIAGNGTWGAAVAQGHAEIAITRIPLQADDPQAVKINAIDNRAREKGGMDIERQIAQLTSLPDLDGTGYTPARTHRSRRRAGATEGAGHQAGRSLAARRAPAALRGRHGGY
jgi:ParB-like chromosome segregation protein Spo0J